MDMLSDAERVRYFYEVTGNPMNLAILGNLFSLAGCLLMVWVGLLQTRRRILTLQCLQFALMGLGNFALGAYSGCICNLVSIARNVAFCKWKVSLSLKLGFIALQVLLSLDLLTKSPLQWLPLLAAGIFTWFLDIQSEARLKAIIIFTMVMWLVYDCAYGNYVAAAFDVLTILSTLAGIFRILGWRLPLGKRAFRRKPAENA